MSKKDDISADLGPTKWTDSSMGRHDLYNFEAKIDYTTENKGKKKTEYFLDTYFFIPEALQINKDSYSSGRFFQDLNNHIRFKTPQMTISGLLNPKNVLSPITLIKDCLEKIERGLLNDRIVEKIDYECRLLGCIIKVNLRDQFNFFFTEYRTVSRHKQLFANLKNYLDEIESLQDNLGGCKLNFEKVQIPPELREAFTFTDDYISLQIEVWLTRALEVFKDELADDLKSRIVSIVNYEQDHRKINNSQMLYKENIENEAYSYWESILKKYVQSVLYLDRKPKDPKSSTLELLYSIAAGLAMFASLLLGFLIASRFEENSMPFITALVVAYMLKDRIKENVRHVSNKAVGIMFPDRRVDIYDSFHEKKIGYCKESMHFLHKNDLPHQIIRIREASNKRLIESQGKPEEIFVYKKKITLYNKEIESIHTRHGDISDIIRFNIREFLRYADDSVQNELIWNSENQKVEMKQLPKVYHLNLVFRLRTTKDTMKGKIFYKKVRVVLNQKGIKRVVEPKMSF